MNFKLCLSPKGSVWATQVRSAMNIEQLSILVKIEFTISGVPGISAPHENLWVNLSHD
jgi:hypothetical protein